MRKVSELFKLVLNHPDYLVEGGEWHLCYIRANMFDKGLIDRQEDFTLGQAIYAAMDENEETMGAPFLLELFDRAVHMEDLTRKERLRSHTYREWAFNFWNAAIAKLESEGK